MKRRGAHSDEAFFVLGNHFGSIVVGWPAQGLESDPHLSRMRSNITHDKIRWEIVSDLGSWEASELRWYSPLSCQTNDIACNTIVGCALGWTSLLQCSAGHCFGAMTMSQLGMLVSVGHGGRGRGVGPGQRLAHHWNPSSQSCYGAWVR